MIQTPLHTRSVAPQLSWMVLGAVVFSGLWCWANQATAGCGDYIFVRDAQGQLVRASSLMPGHASHSGAGHCTGPNCLAGNQIPQADLVPPASRPVKAPCNGPHCQQSPSLPFTPVPAPASPLVEKHLVLLSAGKSGPASSFSSRLDLDNSVVIAAAYIADIFHPPRV